MRGYSFSGELPRAMPYFIVLKTAIKQGIAEHRNTLQQIEYWAVFGKIAEENPELSFNFITDLWKLTNSIC
jgi:hypothetical protein